jgi:hypothetical protein
MAINIKRNKKMEAAAPAVSTVNEGALRRILEAACEKTKACLSDLTVLSTQIDPYRIDTATGHRDGAWLAEQLAKFYGPTKTAHWRGLHYTIVADGAVKKPDGAIYQNIDDDWQWLITAPAKAARWLGYVPFDRIRDARNSPPIIHHKPKVEPEAYLSIGLDVEIPDAEDIEPIPVARGFVTRHAYHFVIFGEKSSLEEIVLPIAQRYEADLYLPTGEISDTLVYQIAKEADEDGRPLILFTLSDCDPAGHQMPVSIGRKLQAFRDLFFPRLRFEVVPVALTAEQVNAENLPSTPLKEGEKRATRWKEAFGIEQTEIDALTIPTKRPILERLIRHAFKPYIDPTLKRRVDDAKAEWYAAAQEAVTAQIDAEHLTHIRDQAAAKLDEMRDQIAQINEALNIAAGDHFTLPPVDVPEPEHPLDSQRHALVRLKDDWVRASRALIKHKAYGR